MSRSNLVWSFISHNKYWLVIIIGLLITCFLDENSVMKRVKLEMQIRDLKEQIAKYNDQYASDQAKLEGNPHESQCHYQDCARTLFHESRR